MCTYIAFHSIDSTIPCLQGITSQSQLLPKHSSSLSRKLFLMNTGEALRMRGILFFFSQLLCVLIVLNVIQIECTDLQAIAITTTYNKVRVRCITVNKLT